MKFFSVLPLATLALSSVITRRDTPTVFGTISDSVDVLAGASLTDLAEIQSVVAAIQGSTEATIEAQIKATIKEDYDAVISAFQAATNAIVSVTTGAVGGVVGSITALTQQEIEILEEALRASAEVIAQVQATITVTVTNLPAQAVKLINSEIRSLKRLLKPFVDPIEAFVMAVEGFSATAGIEISALIAVYQNFTTVVQDAAATLGIPNLH